MNEQLIVETLFYCMVCDGDTPPEEQAQLKQTCLLETNLQEEEIEQSIHNLTVAFAEQANTINSFLKQLSSIKLDEAQQVFLIECLIQMILADGVLHQKEILYFKGVCKSLSISRELICENFPEIEEWLDVEIVEDFSDLGNIANFVD